MSPRFDEFIEWTLAHEGGFIDHPNDPGGATNWGISLRFLLDIEGASQVDWDLDGDGDVDAHDMKLMTREQAKVLYWENFWFAELDELDAPVLAAKLFDMGVNMGMRQGAKIVQRALAHFDNELVIDGHFGPKSAYAANQHVSRGTFKHLITDVCASQGRFYFDLVDAKRSREVFLLGWLRRAYWLP